MDTHSSGSKQIKYCICRSTISNVFMIMCDNCEEWFHGDCVGITRGLSKEIDVYCCAICQKNNPNLKTTFKQDSKNKHEQKRKMRKKIKKSKPKFSEKSVNNQPTEKNNQNNSESIQELHSNSTVNDDLRCFDFVDTTIRKAKTDAYEKFKKSVANESGKKDKKEDELKQCYGPECTKASRKGSKYCSDDCGMALARNRIVELLPGRIRQYTNTPSAADEMSRSKLKEIRTKLEKIKKDIAALDVQIILLQDEIDQAKKPENIFEEHHSDDITPADCVLCGAEVQSKTVEKHMELCYRRQERKILVTEYTKKPDDEQWNVFCNQKIAKNVYCKKLRVLCPLHYKDHRKEDQVCGYPLKMAQKTKVYCGNVGKTCSHTNWEEIERAELDSKKFGLLIEYNRLIKKEEEIRKQMASRGDLLSLLLNQTIIH